ncbi:MAG: matrixin family metalloprotease [Planctomycetota bacterium]
MFVRVLISALLLSTLLCVEARACVYCDAAVCTPCQDAPSAASDGPSGYVLAGDNIQWPQPGGDGTPITITYSYNNFLDGGMRDPSGASIPASFIRRVTEEAFGLWATYAPLHFVEVADAGGDVFVGRSSTYNALPQDSFGQIRISHRFINGTDAQNGMPVAKAMAWLPSSGAGAIGGDIHFDNGDRWGEVGTSPEPDILGIMTHEIGHAIGLAHAMTAESAMWFAAPRRSGPGTGMLWEADIAGVRAIYGEGVGSVTPLMVVPEPATLVAACGAVALAFGLRRRG